MVKRILNPTTGRYYAIRQKTTSNGTSGQIMGLWSPKRAVARTSKREGYPTCPHAESHSCPYFKESETISKDDGMRFKKAYDEVANGVDRGRMLVRLYHIRRKLNWTRERFDRTLEKLRDESIIQLHEGDNTVMKKDEIDDCFIDENGFRHLTITWKK